MFHCNLQGMCVCRSSYGQRSKFLQQLISYQQELRGIKCSFGWSTLLPAIAGSVNYGGPQGGGGGWAGMSNTRIAIIGAWSKVPDT